MVMFKATETVYFELSRKKPPRISYVKARFYKISIKAVKCCIALRYSHHQNEYLGNIFTHHLKHKQ